MTQLNRKSTGRSLPPYYIGIYSAHILRNAVSGGATLNLTGGIRGRRKIKGGHIIHLKSHKNASPAKNDEVPSNVEGYQTPDKKRVKVVHAAPLEAMVGEHKAQAPMQ